MGSDCASSLLRPLHRSHGLCVFMLINTNALRSLQRSCRKTVVAMGSDCASILRPLRRSHGLCVFIAERLSARLLMAVYNHWTGLVDWTGGLTLKIIFTLLTRPILACGVMWKSSSLASLCTYSHKTNK